MSEYCLEFINVNGKNRSFSLKDVNFKLEPGFIYAIAGENGAGKTTLMQYILRAFKHYTGNILFEGEDIAGKHSDVMAHIGFVSEDNQFLPDRSAIQNAKCLSYFYDDFDMDLYKKMLEKLDIKQGSTYHKMSRGEKIKMQLAFAIAHKSRLLLLDEATAGLDPVFRIELFKVMRELMAEENVTVLMTSHNMSEIEKNTDYTAIMKDGRLGEFHESI